MFFSIATYNYEEWNNNTNNLTCTEGTVTGYHEDIRSIAKTLTHWLLPNLRRPHLQTSHMVVTSAVTNVITML